MIIDKSQQQNSNVPRNIFASIKSVFSSIKNLITTIIILVQVAIVALILILVFKPAKFWAPIKSYLNEDILTEQSVDSLDEIYDKLNDTQDIEIVSLSASEVEMLLLTEYTEFNRVNISFGRDDLQILLNIDEEIEQPLWLKADFLELADHALRLQSIGFVRYNIPQSFLSKITSNEYLIGILDILDKESVYDIVNGMINKDKLDDGVVITSATITEGELLLVVEHYQNPVATDLR